MQISSVHFSSSDWYDKVNTEIHVYLILISHFSGRLGSIGSHVMYSVYSRVIHGWKSRENWVNLAWVQNVRYPIAICNVKLKPVKCIPSVVLLNMQ